MRTSALVTLLAASLAAPFTAQGQSRTVKGVVFDSVAGVPLAGAVVQVALNDTGSARRLFSGVSDSTGHYVVSGLAPGRYVIGFQHDALRALGIDSPLRGFELDSYGTVSVDLATPSPAVLRNARCGAGDPTRTGMLSGVVADARSGALSGGGTVEVQWTEIGVKDNKLKAVPFSVRADIGEDGSYIACNLTTDAMLAVRVAAVGHRTLDGELVIPVTGVMRRDFTLADTSSTVSGRSRVAGKVLLSDGKPLPSGQAFIAALGIQGDVTNGTFTIPGVPAGTWLVDARALGYEPQSAMVDVAEGSPANVTIRLNTRAQVLDAVSVVGRSNTKEIGVLMGIQQRARLGAGTVFLPGSEALKTATFPADVVRFARGFKYISPTEIQGRTASLLADSPKMVCAGRCERLVQDSSVIGHTSPGEPCTSVREGVKKRYLVIYLDGERFNGGLPELNTSLAMNEVLAIEAYSDVASAPPIWRTADACAVLAVWLKHQAPT